MRVFLAENEYFIQQCVKGAAQLDGHEVLSFNKIDDCMHFFEDFNPDIVLLDVEIDSIDNLKKFCDEINQKFHIPIVMMHSKSFDKSMPSEKYFWLERPFDISSLVANLEDIIESFKDRGRNG